MIKFEIMFVAIIWAIFTVWLIVKLIKFITNKKCSKTKTENYPSKK